GCERGEEVGTLGRLAETRAPQGAHREAVAKPLPGKHHEPAKGEILVTARAGSTSLIRMPQHRPSKGRALGLLTARVVMVALATLLVWLLALSTDRDAAYPPSPLLASLALLPVNIASLWLVTHLLRSEGGSLRELYGVRSDRRLRGEMGGGYVWLVVLYLPFAGA